MIVILRHEDYGWLHAVKIQPGLFSTVEKILQYLVDTGWGFAGSHLTESQIPGRELCGPPDECVGCGYCLD